MCAIAASAVSYGTHYKGSGRRGYVPTTSPAQVHTISGGSASAPVASMSSTRASSYRDVSNLGGSSVTAPVSGITTSASAIHGGVTTAHRNAPKGAPRRNSGTPLPGGACSHCPWEYDPINDVWYCPYCDCDPYDGECEHECVPLSLDLTAVLFFALLSGLYAYRKYRRFPV